MSKLFSCSINKIYTYSNCWEVNIFRKDPYYMGLDVRKLVFGGLRTTQAHLLFAFRQVPYVDLLQMKFQFSS